MESFTKRGEALPADVREEDAFSLQFEVDLDNSGGHVDKQRVKLNYWLASAPQKFSESLTWNLRAGKSKRFTFALSAVIAVEFSYTQEGEFLRTQRVGFDDERPIAHAELTWIHHGGADHWGVTITPLR